jgi:hypothetical protein
MKVASQAKNVLFFVVNTAPKCDASPKPPIYVELHKNQAQGAQFWMVLNEQHKFLPRF